MWRHLTRGLQQRFNRTLCCEKLDSSSKDGNTTVCQPNSCSLIKQLLPSSHNINCCINKYSGRKQKKHYYEESSGNVSQQTLLEAFGWSGALVFCWAVSKHLWLSKTWNRDEENKRRLYDPSFIELLSHIAKTQPTLNYVLPQLKSGPLESPSTEKKESSKVSLDDEFEEAAKVLEEIHNRAMGESLNRRGISCLSKSTGSSEAIKFFIRASELKYPPASFNMGQCHELGIGTKQDFQQAAKWYKIASEQGHATAMYNLGVFHAHGWGGLRSDIDCAKKLFVKAAKLGQPDAIAALDKESKSKAHLLFDTTDVSPLVLNDSDSIFISPNLNVFVNCLKNGLADDVFQQSYGPDTNWNHVSLNSAFAF